MTNLDGVQVPVNEYFLDHPEGCSARWARVHGAYRADDLVVRASGDTMAELARALAAVVAAARSAG